MLDILLAYLGGTDVRALCYHLCDGIVRPLPVSLGQFLLVGYKALCLLLCRGPFLIGEALVPEDVQLLSEGEIVLPSEVAEQGLRVLNLA